MSWDATILSSSPRAAAWLERKRLDVELVELARADDRRVPADRPRRAHADGPRPEDLEVKPDATLDQVEKAFTRLAFEHHPDRGGDPARMAQLNEARQIARQVLGARP